MLSQHSHKDYNSVKEICSLSCGVIRREGFIVLDGLRVSSAFYQPNRFTSKREREKKKLNSINL